MRGKEHRPLKRKGSVWAADDPDATVECSSLHCNSEICQSQRATIE